MNEEGIRVRGLIKCYGGRRVVDGLNLSVKRGTVFGLLGANGAGKSTTIECILGTKKADAGEIRLLGQDPARDWKALFQRVGVQFQEGDYAQEIRVCELCEETASLYRNPADWRALCGVFGIGDKRKAAVKSLSGGERQRLFIVLALIPRPELVFLDELTTGLDARPARRVEAVGNAEKAGSDDLPDLPLHGRGGSAVRRNLRSEKGRGGVLRHSGGREKTVRLRAL